MLPEIGGRRADVARPVEKRRSALRRFAPAVCSLMCLQAAVSFWGASRADFVGNHDTAYYYAVARNVSLGKLHSDNVLWHWLGTPESVERPAGSYWAPGWPFLLGAGMAVLGHSMKQAIWICAGMSTLLPALAFWLTYSIRRDLFVAWLGGLILIPQERMIPGDFTPDIALPTQLCVMLGLCLLLRAQRARRHARGMWLGAGFALGALCWLRGDGWVLLLAAATATFLVPRTSSRRRTRRVGWLLIGAAGCVIPLWGYNVWAFGAVTPPATAMVPFMGSFTDLLKFETDPSFAEFRSRGVPVMLSWVLRAARSRLTYLPLELPLPLLALALCGCVTAGRRGARDARTLPLCLFLVMFWLLPAIIAPVVTENPGRFTQVATPIASVLGALTIGRLLSRWLTRPILAGAAGLTLTVLCVIWFWPLQLRNPLAAGRWVGDFSPIPAYLEQANRPPVRSDDVILTTDPCQVGAVLGVPAVAIPVDGYEAVRQVAVRYRPRYLLVVRSSLWFYLVGSSADEQIYRGLSLRSLQTTEDAAWYEIAGP